MLYNCSQLRANCKSLEYLVGGGMYDDNQQNQFNNGGPAPQDQPMMPADNGMSGMPPQMPDQPMGMDMPAHGQPVATVPATVVGDDKLLSIKQQALQQLSPLISQLDQTPEEKFRTTMMLIQASDDPAMIDQAFAAAQSIPNEKEKARALLDVVNEINYFTHQKNS